MKTQIRWIIGTTLALAILFCASFVVFYGRAQQKAIAAAKSIDKPLPNANLVDLENQPLPKAKLVDLENQTLADSSLRTGQVVLVFVIADCGACTREAEFLTTIVSRKDNVHFYGVVSYGDKATSLRAAQQKFPFKVFFDEGIQLGHALAITRVPMKVYLEDGVMKKVWGGATNSEEKKTAFVQWLDALP
jgi:peroxiredoxin